RFSPISSTQSSSPATSPRLSFRSPLSLSSSSLVSSREALQAPRSKLDEFYGIDFSNPAESPSAESTAKAARAREPDARAGDQHSADSVEELRRIREQNRAYPQAPPVDAGRIFISALSDQSHHSDGTTTSPSNRYSHMFTAGAVSAPQTGTVDCSDLFPDDLGIEPGLAVFRIDRMHPEPIPDDEVGQFCIADCYIVVSTQQRDADDRSPSRARFNDASDDEDSPPPLVGGSDAPDEEAWEARRRARRQRRRYRQLIWTWVGPLAEMDKRFCCAMFAVGLRTWIGGSGKIMRETESEESPGFLGLFGGSVEHIDASLAAESGLYIVQEKSYPLRMYRIYGKSSVKVALVEPKADSLTSDHVYLIDGGMEIFQWNGMDSSLANKAHGGIISESISSSERYGRAAVLEIDEGEEPDRLWEVLNSRRGNLRSTVESNTAFEELSARAPLLYRLPAGVSELDSISSYLVTRADSKSGVFAGLQRTALQSDSCCVLDAGTELFMWLGSRSSVSSKELVAELLARVAQEEKRPTWAAFHRVPEGFESEMFKMRFADWSGPNVKHHGAARDSTRKPQADVGALYAPHPLSQLYDTDRDEWPAAKAAALERLESSVDLATTTVLVSDAVRRPADHAAAVQAAMAMAQGRLAAPVLGFVFDRGGGASGERRFSRLEPWEDGHLCSGEAYVFLAVYRGGSPAAVDTGEPSQATGTNGGGAVANGNGMAHESRRGSLALSNRGTGDRASLSSSSSSVSSVLADNAAEAAVAAVAAAALENGGDGDTGPGVECVVYFWVGRRASKLALSTFRFHSQAEIEGLVRELYDCPVRVVVTEEGREPLALLAHVQNRVVVHRGPRTALLRKRRVAAAAGVPGTVAAETTPAVATNGDSMPAPNALLFQVRADARFQTARAVEVAARTEALVSRDCFFALPLTTRGAGDASAPGAFLWVGRNATRDEARRAADAVRRILDAFRPPPPPVDGDVAASGMGAEPEYALAAEGAEPTAFWTLLEGGRRPHAVGPQPPPPVTTAAAAADAEAAGLMDIVPHFRRSSLVVGDIEGGGMERNWVIDGDDLRVLQPGMSPAAGRRWRARQRDGQRGGAGGATGAAAGHFPRLLVCSCSKGYFSVEERLFFVQADLATSACALVDGGPPAPLRLWRGAAASDVVRKLAGKAAEVWLDALDDGRAGGGSVAVEEGAEDAEFRALFHGWDDGDGGSEGGGVGGRDALARRSAR
ncbi:hypothetical protein HK405_007321, partial [Cladochytrium tenue]